MHIFIISGNVKAYFFKVGAWLMFELPTGNLKVNSMSASFGVSINYEPSYYFT